jgi:hypothetical protein
MDFVAGCRKRKVTPHVAAHDIRRGGSAIDGRTTRHLSCRISQIIRKRIEEHFGWARPSAAFDKPCFAVALPMIRLSSFSRRNSTAC